jgi:hypothetical protein
MNEYNGNLIIIAQDRERRVIPAKAGIQSALAMYQNMYWIPAFAGMTRWVILSGRSEV